MRTRSQMKRLAPICGLAVILALCLGASTCNKAHAAADANHKYAVSLDSFQQAEIKEHSNGKVDDALHIQIQEAVKAASESGKALDQGILLASKGADAGEYIQKASESFNQLSGLIKFKDPTTQQVLSDLVKASSDLLQNAITLIQQLRSENATKAPAPSGMAFFLLMFPLLGMAAVTGAGAALALVGQILELEPIAFTLVANLVQNLKGKTTEEIVAMNEQIFSKISSTADSEIAATKAKLGQ